MSDVFIHPTACVDDGSLIGTGSRVWHFCHVMAGAVIGEDCSLGQNVFVASGAIVGNRVKIQNNVSVYDGVELGDDVFCGPSAVFTNVRNPRAELSRRGSFEKTRVLRGATVGANCTVICGTELGRYAFVGAGAVVSGRHPDYALLLGVPAQQAGWVGRHGHALRERDRDGNLLCPESGFRYREAFGKLSCLDHSEELSLSSSAPR
ncbi:MAG TPA: acyltransferase [Polyangiaceae bacterium]|jgi:UDP-2-acetamido-3-amino-2,3-dideoxy-glucuronate N-acetyltransferase|nr:acyltransferase [Polyangiaceae bacterium]